MFSCLAQQCCCRHIYLFTGALPTEEVETANFICQMDKLIDLFNSSHIKHYKESRCALGMISFKIEIIQNHGYHFGMTDFFSYIEEWKHSISSFKSLWQDGRIYYIFSYLLTYLCLYEQPACIACIYMIALHICFSLCDFPGCIILIYLIVYHLFLLFARFLYILLLFMPLF